MAVHEYASDPDVTRYTGWGPNSREDTTSFLKRVLESQLGSPRENYELAIVLKEDNVLIGGCRISISDQRHHEGFIGYVLNKRYWGHGYATEVVKALFAFGFGELGLHRIYATCDTENIASAHVMEKTGMQLEGRLREYRLQGKNWRDQFIYAILNHEFDY
jgi:ribosomal-protein-alanine N-acetyltransferase